MARSPLRSPRASTPSTKRPNATDGVLLMNIRKSIVHIGDGRTVLPGGTITLDTSLVEKFKDYLSVVEK